MGDQKRGERSTDTEAPSIAARIAELEDEREIRELLIQYAMRLDARDHAGYARLFAENGEWSGGMGQARGPAAIEAMLDKGLGTPPPDFVNTQNFHLMSNFLVTITGDEATALSRLTYFVRGPENTPVPMLAGRYEDHLVREHGRWVFQRRTVIGEIPTMAEVSSNNPAEPSQ